MPDRNCCSFVCHSGQTQRCCEPNFVGETFDIYWCRIYNDMLKFDSFTTSESNTSIIEFIAFCRGRTLCCEWTCRSLWLTKTKSKTSPDNPRSYRTRDRTLLMHLLYLDNHANIIKSWQGTVKHNMCLDRKPEHRNLNGYHIRGINQFGFRVSTHRQLPKPFLCTLQITAFSIFKKI